MRHDISRHALRYFLTAYALMIFFADDIFARLLPCHAVAARRRATSRVFLRLPMSIPAAAILISRLFDGGVMRSRRRHTRFMRCTSTLCARRMPARRRYASAALAGSVRAACATTARKAGCVGSSGKIRCAQGLRSGTVQRDVARAPYCMQTTRSARKKI